MAQVLTEIILQIVLEEECLLTPRSPKQLYTNSSCFGEFHPKECHDDNEVTDDASTPQNEDKNEKNIHYLRDGKDMKAICMVKTARFEKQ